MPQGMESSSPGSLHPGTIRSSGGPISSLGRQLPLSPWPGMLAASQGLAQPFHLPALQPISRRRPGAAQMEPRLRSMTMPVQAFLLMTVKLSGPLFLIYITDARVGGRPSPNESQLPPSHPCAFCFSSDGLLTFNSDLPAALTSLVLSDILLHDFTKL